jgi:curved DNA-binding protein CbpA
MIQNLSFQTQISDLRFELRKSKHDSATRMEGQLAENPLAELIREIVSAELSGALRVSRERAKVIGYFRDGQLIFAASNLRPHRLREVLQRNGLTDAQLKDVPAKASDEETAAALLTAGILTPETLQKIRSGQVSDVIRAALLWTDGRWEFDQRVRIADAAQVQVDVDRLLLECARHLPLPFIKSRFKTANGVFALGVSSKKINLSQTEEFILSRATIADGAIQLGDLTGNNLPEEDGLRGAYALSLSGLLQRSDWPVALPAKTFVKPKSTKGAPEPAPGLPEKAARARDDQVSDVDAWLARMSRAKDHYEVLDVARAAKVGEIKDAYHTLARQYHPDRFHQSAPDLRNRIESAFARVAQAYEILSDPMRRADYDQKRSSDSSFRRAKARAVDESAAQPLSKAENSFRQGMAALQRNQQDDAIRFLAEAAILEPQQARYRAHYGHALMNRSKARRTAETELLAAVALEPGNPTFRVMLAELYQSVGMRRRAENEAARALALDSQNEKARAILADLRNK